MLHHFHHFCTINLGYRTIFKGFGPNGRHEATLAENFCIESPVFVASRPPACSNGGTQVFLLNFSANSQFQILFSDVSGHFSMTSQTIIFFSLPYVYGSRELNEEFDVSEEDKFRKDPKKDNF